MKLNNKTGIAIVLAWPQTYCKQPGSWYDGLMTLLGINYNNYYQVGHAAIVLIDSQQKKCKYFDFGRYHAPFQHGRVRSAETDFDLILKTRPNLSSDGLQLINYDAILHELQSRSAFHGDGILEASYTPINFKKALQKALEMQQQTFLPYGPFAYRGSNCSRFVHAVVNAGLPLSFQKIRLNWFIPFTPTPMSNVKAFPFRKSQEKNYKATLFTPTIKLTKRQQTKTLEIPKKPTGLENAFWLSGEGCGSWFDLHCNDDQLHVKRYSPSGDLECQSAFPNHLPFNIHAPEVQITYPSNCKELTLQYKSEHIYLQSLHPS